MDKSISEITRRQIIDFFVTVKIDWSGRLADDEFLVRLYDLNALPSADSRFDNAAADIHQHTVNWSDWQPDWIFFDSRFDLLRGSNEQFLAFLCETVHPVVRPDSEEALGLGGFFNEVLAPDGWMLIEWQRVSDRVIYRAARRDGMREVAAEPTGWEKVDRQRQEARLRLDTARNEEQFQVVGLLCREVLISTAQGSSILIDTSRPMAQNRAPLMLSGCSRRSLARNWLGAPTRSHAPMRRRR